MAEEVNRKPFHRAITSEWIFRHPRYVRYMAREFSCIFIGGWTLMMVWGLKQLVEGPTAWAMPPSIGRSSAGACTTAPSQPRQP